MLISNLWVDMGIVNITIGRNKVMFFQKGGMPDLSLDAIVMFNNIVVLLYIIALCQ